MLETQLSELTKAVIQLTVTIEALLEAQRASGPVKKSKKSETTPAPEAAEPAPAAQPEPVVAEPVKAAPKPRPIELNDIRAAAQVLLDAKRHATIKAIVAEYGVGKLSEVTPDKYPALLARLIAEAANGPV